MRVIIFILFAILVMALLALFSGIKLNPVGFLIISVLLIGAILIHKYLK